MKWIKAILSLTERSFRSYYQFNDINFVNLMKLWTKMSKFKTFCDYSEEEKKKFQIQQKFVIAFERYCYVYFFEDNLIDFFEDVHYKGFLKFNSYVRKRFNVFTNFFGMNEEICQEYVQILLKTAGNLFLKTEVRRKGL